MIRDVAAFLALGLFVHSVAVWIGVAAGVG